MVDHCLLYYITDQSQFRGDERARRRALLDKISEAAQAGVNYIQLREKNLSARELETLARDALTVMRHSSALRTENREPRTGPPVRTRLLINSRTDVALATGADGVHLRSDDVAAHEVHQVLEGAHQPLNTDHFLVAVSCHTAVDLHRAESEKVDFAVFAPVFGKNGARGTPPAGLAALHEACQAKIPIFRSEEHTSELQ